jgi:hypothetical protein
MNIQKVFEALDEDQDNSAIGIICAALERQGYKVRIERMGVALRDIFDGACASE